ncbi:hypothetical protein C0992_010710, partial [Termitomyces sp. T32_za158]
MSSDSSLGVALVTGASTEIGRAIALRLAKNFDIAINDLPEALKPLEVLKGQIEKEGRKSAIITGDPSIESFWANIGSAIDNRWGLSKAIGKGPRCALIFVVVDEDGSVPGAVDPVKSAIRGLTEAAVHAPYDSKKQTHIPPARGLVKDNTIQK